MNCICPGWVDTPMNQRLAEELGGMDKLTPIILQPAAERADALHARDRQRGGLPGLGRGERDHGGGVVRRWRGVGGDLIRVEKSRS